MIVDSDFAILSEKVFIARISPVGIKIVWESGQLSLKIELVRESQGTRMLMT